MERSNDCESYPAPSNTRTSRCWVVDLPAKQRQQLIDLLTFETIPTWVGVELRARAIVDLLETEYPFVNQAMIGGAPYLMAPLERELLANGVKPMYAFSIRESVEHVGSDGSVKKVSVFRHVGFV